MTKKIKVKIELPKNVISFMDELIGRGYYKSRSEMFRVALIDLIIEKFDIDIDDIEPDILEKFEEEEEEEKVIIAEPAALLEEEKVIIAEPAALLEEKKENRRN